jgi:hypothetical protein
VGVALLVAVGGLHSRDHPVALAGVTLIIVTGIPLPWGSERYRRACARNVSGASRALQHIEGQFRAADTRHLKEFQKVPVPARLEEATKELLSVWEADGFRHDRAATLKDRAMRRMELRERVRDIQGHVAALAETDNEKGYSKILGEILAARERDSEERTRENGATLAKLIAQQQKLSPPEPLRRDHALLCDAFRDEQTAMWRYYAALRGGDTRSLQKAVEQYEGAADICIARLTALRIPSRRHHGLRNAGVESGGSVT